MNRIVRVKMAYELELEIEGLSEDDAREIGEDCEAVELGNCYGGMIENFNEQLVSYTSCYIEDVEVSDVN